MSPKPFSIGLGMTITIQLVVCLLLVHWIPALQIHTAFILISILVMAIFCSSLYLAARMVVQSSLTRLYIQLVMIAVFIKLTLCLALVVVYTKGFEPLNSSFLWPFLFIYITSTIYEVRFLEKVGRQKNTPAS